MKKCIFHLVLSGFVLCGVSSCSTTTPLTATNNPVGDKTGVSKNTCLFASERYPLSFQTEGQITSNGLCFNTSDYSIKEAADKAGIDKVGAVDLRKTNYIIWTEFELVVSGE